MKYFFGLLLAWWLSEPYWGFIEIGLSSSASVGKNPRQSLCIYKNLVFIWKGLCSGSTFDGRMIEWPNANCSQIYRLHKLCMHRPQTQIWIVSIHIKALQRKPISRQFNSNNLREFPRSKLWLKLTQLEPRQCHRLTICFLHLIWQSGTIVRRPGLSTWAWRGHFNILLLHIDIFLLSFMSESEWHG